MDPGGWLPLLQEYRLTALHSETVLRGSLLPDLSPTSPEVQAVLDGWEGSAHLHKEDGVTDVVLVYSLDERPASRHWVHALLFLATLLTTHAAGAMMLGRDPFATHVLAIGGLLVPYPTSIRWGMLVTGAPFAVPFMCVLLAHEMGHFVAARIHRVRATLPYFLPFPPYLSIIGTIGAFIRLRGPTVRRAGLFDIGASGPVASFLLSIPLLAVGFSLSDTVPAEASITTPFMVRFVGESVWLGSGLLTSGLAWMFGPEGALSGVLVLHPLAFAGWLGLFVTALNLIPIGQLDGGHILYALFRERQGNVARAFVIALVPFGLLWRGWWAWAAILVVLHRGRMVHPPVLQPAPEVGAPRSVLGWILVVIFFLTFIPVPLSL
jgi:membrane-associated protease RseP (regulator of RpoE activity)